MASRFWVGGTGTWDSSNTANWSATTGGAGGASVPGSADTVTIDANSGTGTITVNGTVNVLGVTFNAANNIILDFSVYNNNVTIGSQFACSGTGIRTLKMGSGIWTFPYTGASTTVWNLATTTNLTFDAGKSTIRITGATSSILTFAGGGLTYYTLEVARGSGTGQITISGSNTFVNFIDNTSTAAHTYSFVSGTTTTFYTFNVKGSPGALITLAKSSAAAANFVKVGQGVVNCNYITAGGNTPATPSSGVWYAGPNSTGGGSGWILTAPTSSQSLLGAGGVG